MNNPRFTASRIMLEGKPAAEMVVRNTTQGEHAEFRAILDGLGFGPANGIDNAKRIVVKTIPEVDAVRGPLSKFFDAKGEWK